jgi:hypothetical protein
MSPRIIVEALLLVTWWGLSDLLGRRRAKIVDLAGTRCA